MSDLVARLEELAGSPRMALDRGVLRWAAAEIERLRASLEAAERERDEAQRWLWCLGMTQYIPEAAAKRLDAEWAANEAERKAR